MSSYARKYSGIVKQYLLDGVDLTHATLIENGHGWRLAAVICYLRKQGWPIETLLDVRRIGHYRLPPGWNPEMLKSGSPQAANLGGGND